MNRREFLGASSASLLLAGCFGSDSDVVVPDTLHVSRFDVIVADADGTLFRTRPYSRTVARLAPGGATEWTTGTYGKGTGQFDFPDQSIADTRGRLLVSDRGNGRVAMLEAATGRWLGQIGASGTGPGQFRQPRQIALGVDRIYVVDPLNHRVNVYDDDGRSLFAIGRPGTGPGDLNMPRGVAVDGLGRVYVTDGRGAAVKRYSANGVFETRVDGRLLGSPNGLAVDRRGYLWVADGFSGRVVALSPEGTLAQAITARLSDGRSAAPRDIALAGRDIYVRAGINGPKV